MKKGPTSSGSTPTGPAHPARPHPAIPNPSPTHHTTWNTNPSPTHTLKSNIRFQKNRKNEGAPNAKGEGAFSQWSNQRLGITCKNVLEVWKLSTVRWARYYLWDLANLFITCVVLQSVQYVFRVSSAYVNFFNFLTYLPIQFPKKLRRDPKFVTLRHVSRVEGKMSPFG